MAGDEQQQPAPVNRVTAGLVSVAGGAVIAILLVWLFDVDYDAVLTGPVTIRNAVDSLAALFAFIGGTITIWRVMTRQIPLDDD
jgi:formate hydrogenlyase subunit 3/multisubunit Na+/H+ antiporter MnhD subunit